MNRIALLVAAALALPSATPAAELNFTADDLGSGRFNVDFYIPSGLGAGAGTWYYGALPFPGEPVLTHNLSAGTQNGSVNFRDYRNGTLVQAFSGVSPSITVSVYQDGVVISDTLIGVAAVFTCFIPNISVKVENFGQSTAAYNVYNPDTYNAVLNVSGSTINGTAGRNAIHTDPFVDTVVNLTGTNRVNGGVVANEINLNGGFTTFNGGVAGLLTLGEDTRVDYTAQATLIVGDIVAQDDEGTAEGQEVNFWGGNTHNGSIALGLGSAVNFRGTGVVLNGDTVAASRFNVLTPGTVTLGAGADLLGDLDLGDNDATVILSDQTALRSGSVTTGFANVGRLNLLGSSVIEGSVGSSSTPLAQVTAGVTGSVSFLNGLSPSAGMTHVGTLRYAGAGVVVLNGANGGAAASGLVGTVDFDGRAGTLRVGAGVNLTFGQSGIVLADASEATLSFDGSSTVTGAIGGVDAEGDPTAASPRDIRAGSNGATVTFLGPVTVSGTTFHVTGTGTVNLEEGLVGPLVYEEDGTVNVGAGKLVDGRVTTDADNQGVLNFLGGTETKDAIGDALLRLRRVHFHSDTAVGISAVTLAHDIRSVETRVGNGTTLTAAAITANIALGTDVTLSPTTALVTAGGQSLVGASVDFTHTKDASTGELDLATVTQSTFGNGTGGVLRTEGATLGFAVQGGAFDPAFVIGDATTPGGAVSLSGAASSRITGGAGSTLVMTGGETVRVGLLGSLRNGQVAVLIDVDSGVTGAQAGTLLDNSYVIDTVLDRLDGDLRVITQRDGETYVNKAGLAGTRLEALARSIGALAASGESYGPATQAFLNKLDLDQWGYGFDEASLARQFELISPSGNGAYTLAATTATGGALGQLVNGAAPLSAGSGLNLWFAPRALRVSRGTEQGFAGFSAKGALALAGADKRFGATSVGVSLGAGTVHVGDRGSRAGDSGDVTTALLGVYARRSLDLWQFDAAVLAASHATDYNRAYAVGERVDGDYTADEIAFRFQAGRRFVFGKDAWTLTPTLGIERSDYDQPGYSETGADGIGLEHEGNHRGFTSATLDFRASTNSGGLSLAGIVGYRHLLSGPDHGGVATFLGGGDPVSYTGIDEEEHRGSLRVGLELGYEPAPGVTYSFSYDFTDRGDLTQHGLTLRADWRY